MHQLIGEFIACITALWFVSSFSAGFRLLALHAIMAFLVELCGYVLDKKMHTGNTWLFNSFLIVDCGIQLLAAYKFKIRIPGDVFIGLFIGFLAIWMMEVYANGIGVFTVKAYVVDSLLQLSAFLFVLHGAAMKHTVRFIRCPELWACLGIVIFYGCNVPFFSMLHYLLIIKASDVVKTLFIILQGLIQIRYLFVAAAFFMCYRNYQKVKLHADVIG